MRRYKEEYAMVSHALFEGGLAHYFMTGMAYTRWHDWTKNVVWC